MNQRFRNRYASAVRSKNLKSDPRTSASDSDVVGAVGLASKPVRTERDETGAIVHRPGSPLGMALLRLFVGDGRGESETTEVLAGLLRDRCEALGYRPKMRLAARVKLSEEVLKWHRHGTCRTCGGHGFKVAGGILGSSRAVISDSPCDDCRGAGKIPFDLQFSMEQLDLARWLREQIEREQGRAGVEAMKALGEML